MATNCCCSGSTESGVLVQILQQEAAIAVRWSQVQQARGVPVTRPAVIAESSCSESEARLLERLLEQRRAIFNSMFLG